MKVWVTRDEPGGGPLCTALERAGLEPILEPVLKRRVVADVGEAIAGLGREDWLVLTSEFAIEAVPQAPARGPRMAVVGEASRRAAEGRGFRVALTSDDGTARGLFAQLASQARGRTVLYPRSALARVPDLPDDVELISPVLYETVERAYRREVAAEVGVVVVVSPSAVRAIGRVDLRYASIGPTTTAALCELDVAPWVEAPEPSFDALAQAIAERARTQS